MSDIKIYHNNRCSKSRAGMQYLEEKGLEAEVVNYMVETITEEELTGLLAKLGMKPLDLIRKNEDLFKTEYKDKDLSDAEWIRIMAQNPKLIERPIVVCGNKAVVARPTEKIDELF